MSNETDRKTVSRDHAMMALHEAVSRMNAALYQAAQEPDAAIGEQFEVRDMVVEAGNNAAAVALEILSDLNILGYDRDPDLTYKGCYKDWLAWMNDSGPAIKVQGLDDEVMALAAALQQLKDAGDIAYEEAVREIREGISNPVDTDQEQAYQRIRNLIDPPQADGAPETQ
ncbi:hypothetical protein TspCOW1_07340 [Thiohalobacter sp. COW1]|uniref:hypothetical protein n=1 Tax=Thiohalobacter sp. COW1 TaxID=2795687 RepID=UPI001915349F|nr:hypothetical protein [Thiohalobacter sp. COW1]BCO30631.1 hypothetical protein TspCOW1_07340 [Thiohalobacter sp. COW1]